MTGTDAIDQQLIEGIYASRLRETLAGLATRSADHEPQARAHIAEWTEAISALDADVDAELARLRETFDAGGVAVLAVDRDQPDRVLHTIEVIVHERDIDHAVGALATAGYTIRGSSTAHSARHNGRVMLWPDDGTQFRVRLRWQPRSRSQFGLARAKAAARSIRTRLPGHEASSGLAPFLGTPDDLIDPLLRFAPVKTDHLLVDLGSGDGRILVRAAQAFGARGRGYETDAALCERARHAVRDAGLDDRVTVRHQDAAQADVSDADVLFLFLPVPAIEHLVPVLLERMKPGAVVVAHEQQVLSCSVPADERRPLIRRGGVTVAHKWTATGGGAQRL